MYAIQVDQMRELELAVISRGGDVEPGEGVEKFNDWLNSEPEPYDHEKAQLFGALGVGPPV